MVLDEDQVVPSTHFSYDQLCHMDSALPIIYLISLGPFSHTSLNLGRCPCPSYQGHWHSSEMYLFSDTCLASSPPQASGTVASRKDSQNTGTSRNGLRGQGRMRSLTASNPPRLMHPVGFGKTRATWCWNGVGELQDAHWAPAASQCLSEPRI